MDTLIFPFFCYIYGVYTTRFIYMVIVMEILLTCIIYSATLYHQSERDISNFCVTWILLWFGKEYTHMISSYWSDSNEYFPCLRQIIRSLFWTILCKFYLSTDYFGIKRTTMQIYLDLCLDVLRKKTLMSMNVYLITGQDEILLHWRIIFACSTIRPLIFTG